MMTYALVMTRAFWGSGLNICLDIKDVKPVAEIYNPDEQTMCVHLKLLLPSDDFVHFQDVVVQRLRRGGLKGSLQCRGKMAWLDGECVQQTDGRLRPHCPSSSSSSAALPTRISPS